MIEKNKDWLESNNYYKLTDNIEMLKYFNVPNHKKKFLLGEIYLPTLIFTPLRTNFTGTNWDIFIS